MTQFILRGIRVSQKNPTYPQQSSNKEVAKATVLSRVALDREDTKEGTESLQKFKLCERHFIYKVIVSAAQMIEH